MKNFGKYEVRCGMVFESVYNPAAYFEVNKIYIDDKTGKEIVDFIIFWKNEDRNDKHFGIYTKDLRSDWKRGKFTLVNYWESRDHKSTAAP